MYCKILTGVLIFYTLFGSYFLYKTDVIRLCDDHEESYLYLKRLIGFIVNSTEFDKSESTYRGSIVLQENEFFYLQKFLKTNESQEAEIERVYLILKQTFQKRPFDYYYTEVVTPLFTEILYLITTYLPVTIGLTSTLAAALAYLKCKEMVIGIALNILMWSLYNTVAVFFYIWFAVYYSTLHLVGIRKLSD